MEIKNIDWITPDMITNPYNTVVVDRCKLKNHVCYAPTADGLPIGNWHTQRIHDYMQKNTVGRVFDGQYFVPTSQEDVNIKVNNFRNLLYDSEIFILEKQKKDALYNVSTKYPLIFVHIPKTAGTSLNKVLDISEDVGGHKTLKFLKSLLNKSVYDSHKKVAIIRNPFDRLVSVYKERYWENSVSRFKEMTGEKTVKENNYSFESWFWDIMSHVNNVGQEPLFYLPCYDLMVDESNELAVDYIIRYENLEEDLKNMFNDMGFDAPTIPKLNVASTKHPDLFQSNSKVHYSEYYEGYTKDVMIDFVYEIFKKDFDAFGYKFEQNKMEKINETN